MKSSALLSLVVAAVLVQGARSARAADAKDLFEARVHESGEKKLNYRLMLPADYDKEKTYPLVIFLHGSGERGDDNVAQLVHGMNDFSKDENRTKFPCFVMAPQCPRSSSWARFRRGETPAPEPSEPLQLVLELIDKLQKDYSIDSRRLYLTGLSMGGYGTWDLIQRYPDKFAAAAPVCGGGDEQQAAKLVRLPIWIFHGDKDTSVPPERSREMVAAIKTAGGKPLYTEFVGVGHNSWVPTYSNPMLMSWLFAQQKAE